jgi:hypothetical protein
MAVADNGNPTDRDGTYREVLAAQAEMFRLAERDYGLTLRAIASETGISVTTLKGFTNSNPFARSRIGLPDFVILCRVLPDELTSLCFEPAAKHVGTNEAGEGDFDSLTVESAGFAADKLAREADGVLCHIDRAALKDRARRISAKARAVAA